MERERERAAIFYSTTLNPTKEFPINTMHAQAVLRQIADDGSRADLEKAIKAFYAAIWHFDKPVATAENLEDILKPEFDQATIKAWLEKSMEKPARSRLQEEAKQLAEHEGVFGMPWMVMTRAADNQTISWFGSDRFEQIANWLDKPYKGPDPTRTGPAPKL